MGIDHVPLDKDAVYEAAHPHMSALEVRMRERVLARREKNGEASMEHHQENDGMEERSSGAKNPSTRGGDEEEGSSAREEEEEDAKRGLLEGTGRGRKSTAAVVVPSRQIAVANSDLLTAWERRRQEYKERKRIGGHRQRDTLAKLQKFTQGLNGTASSSRQPAEEATTEIPAPQEEADGGYSGRVRRDIDHAAYMPAAWRVDEYLDTPAVDDIASLRAHR